MIAAIVSPKRHPARDLLAQEEADHLALVVGLHLLAGDDDDVAAARELGDLERAGEDVVVGDRDRAEAFRLCVLEQQRRRHPAVVGRARVHVEVDDDPVAIGERVSFALRRAAPAAQAFVDLLEAERDVRERLALRGRSARSRLALAVGVVLREAPHLRRRELRLLARPGRGGDGRARRGGLEREPRQAVRRGHEDRRLVEDRGSAGRLARGAHVDAVEQRARNVRARRERLRRGAA